MLVVNDTPKRLKMQKFMKYEIPSQFHMDALSFHNFFVQKILHTVFAK